MGLTMDLLSLRVETSRKIGQDASLVLHGGGNTSVKFNDLIYVKASGWNLDTIEKEGFAPCRISMLLDILKHDTLSDSDMVRLQREAIALKMANGESFPNPSIEAVLHALIPFSFVDHTHADAVVTISNSVDGEKILRQIYGEGWVIIPYVMPGFVLAKVVHEATKDLNWSEIKGIILLNHGIFTFDNDGMRSYQKMVDGVKIASDYLAQHTSIPLCEGSQRHDIEAIKQIISKMRGYEVACVVNTSPLAQTFACRDDLGLSQQGVLTPEHIIRTKRKPVILDCDYTSEIEMYKNEYTAYFERHQKGEIILDTTPNWGILKGYGTISFGKNEKEASIIRDINDHTMEAMMRATQLGGYVSICEADSFAMEYWELEQAKLKK